MPIPDWVAGETRHLHLGCFHVLAAMFTAGTVTRLEDGTLEYALREEWAEEEGILDRFVARRVWRQLVNRGLVEYRAEDHIAVSGRKRGSYICRDRIVQFSHVPNRVDENCTNLTASAPLPAHEFESDPAISSRAHAGDIIRRDARAGHPSPSSASPSPSPSPSPASAQDGITMPSLEQALELIGFTEEGQADELVRSFGFNSTAVAVRNLVRSMRGAAKGKQPPVSSKTGYVIQHLGTNRKVQFAEVENYGFLVELVRLLVPAETSGRVIEFPAKGD